MTLVVLHSSNWLLLFKCWGKSSW